MADVTFCDICENIIPEERHRILQIHGIPPDKNKPKTEEVRFGPFFFEAPAQKRVYQIDICDKCSVNILSILEKARKMHSHNKETFKDVIKNIDEEFKH